MAPMHVTEIALVVTVPGFPGFAFWQDGGRYFRSDPTTMPESQ